jgi:hypothetical protein
MDGFELWQESLQQRKSIIGINTTPSTTSKHSVRIALLEVQQWRGPRRSSRWINATTPAH